MDTPLPTFIERGMAFFNGELVAKNLLTSANEQIEAFKVMDVTREKLLTEANQKVADLLAETSNRKAIIDDLNTRLAASEATVKALEANMISAGRQTGQALSALGLKPVNADNTPANADPKGFVELVNEQVKTGKTKAAAIVFCITNFPNEYKAAKEAGLPSKF